MQEIDDKFLMEQIQANNPDALEELYRRHYKALCRLSVSLVDRKDAAQEIVTDVFVNIWTKRDALKIEDSISNYLYTSVRNGCINYMQAPKESFEDIDREVEEKLIAGTTADSKINYKDTLNYVERLIEELPKKRRQIFKLSRIDGLKHAEIAQMLSVSVSTVQRNITASLRLLADSQTKAG